MGKMRARESRRPKSGYHDNKKQRCQEPNEGSGDQMSASKERNTKSLQQQLEQPAALPFALPADQTNTETDSDDIDPKIKAEKELTTTSSSSKSKKTATTNTATTITNSHPDSFASIQPPLSAGILQYLQDRQFDTMTPVQAATLPHFLTHKDVAVQAVTGSGKTLAFLIPCIEMMLRRTTLLSSRQVGALVLSPTRELAQQTYQICCELCQYASLPPPLLLVGGAQKRPVTEDLRLFQTLKSDVVIGTPGRVEDVLTRYNVMDMSELECLILDEADVLLDMGFDMTLQHILSHLPKMRRTGLFSATGTAAAAAAAAAAATSTSSTAPSKPTSHHRRGLQQLVQKAGMRNPIWIHVAIASNPSNNNTTNAKQTLENKSITPSQQQQVQHQHQHLHQATPSSLINYYMITPLEQKLSRLLCFLESHRDEKVIVFFLTCACVEFYGKALSKKFNLNIETLHGKMVQKRRECAVERFRKSILKPENDDDDDDDDDDNNEIVNNEKRTEKNSPSKDESRTATGSFLFCTDVASRGLDITDVDWVLQFDAPQGEPDSYVHRVGRCARAGRTGSSLLFLTPKEDAYVDLLRMRQVPLVPLPETERCAPPPPPTTAPPADSETATTTTAEPPVEEIETPEAGSKCSGERIIRSAADPSIRILDVLTKIRDMVLKDRDLLEKGTKAFTSYIRAYKEHHCSFIFRFASLDLGVLATSFCLLRLPKMPELRDQLGKIYKTFKAAGPDVDIHAIPFLDKVREDARQKRLAAILAAGGKNAKQIKAEQRQAARLKREQDRRQTAISKGRNPDKKRGRNAQIMDEWDDLAKEERLYKKLRRGKINKEQYKQLMYGDKDKEEAASDDDSSASDSE